MAVGEDDMHFQKLVLEEGYVTRDQLDACVQIRKQLPEKHSIKRILLARGYLTGQQLDEIQEKQREHRREHGRLTRRLREEQLFGQIVQNFKYASEEEVQECLRIQEKLQEKEDEIVPLGEILLERGYVTDEQHLAVVNYQKNNLLNCPVCSTTFNVIQYRPGAKLDCYNCDDGSVTVPDPDD